jgi:hypothetical protein
MGHPQFTKPLKWQVKCDGMTVAGSLRSFAVCFDWALLRFIHIPRIDKHL